MRFFLFKILINLAALIFPDKMRADLLRKYSEQQITLYKRQLEMDSCIRAKAYPKIPEGAKPPTYTDYFER
jgi:hypothetical protein